MGDHDFKCDQCQPSTRGKKGMDKKGMDKTKTKDVMVIVKDRLTEFTNSMSALTSRVEGMNKRSKKLKSMGDMDELRGEMQVAMSSMVAEVQASKADCKAKVKALEARIKLCMAWMANGEVIQVSAAPRGNAPRPPLSTGLEVQWRSTTSFEDSYFKVMGIEDDVKKVTNVSFSLKDITLVWRHHRCDDIRS